MYESFSIRVRFPAPGRTSLPAPWHNLLLVEPFVLDPVVHRNRARGAVRRLDLETISRPLRGFLGKGSVMRKASTLALLLALLCAVPLTTPAGALAEDATTGEAAEETAAPAPASNLPPGMTIYYMAFLHSCPEPPEMEPAKLQQVQAAHLANIGDMAEEGILLLAGPFAPVEGSDLAGIFLFQMDSLEAAEERTAQDPAVQAGRLCPKIIPWLGPVDITHGYDEAVAKARG